MPIDPVIFKKVTFVDINMAIPKASVEVNTSIHIFTIQFNDQHIADLKILLALLKTIVVTWISRIYA